MPELSIIVPAYNVEKFINICLDSLANQIFRDSEIIVIDDASKDATREVISEYYRKLPNMTIIDNPQNIGVGESRNIGVNVANGKYIGFIDSDDWVDLNYYQIMMSVAHSTHADIVIAGIEDEYGNHISAETRYAYNEKFTIDGRIGLRLLTKSESFGTYITPIMNNKVYRKAFLLDNNIICSNNKSWQDDYFSFFSILYADKIAFTPDTMYHYRQCHSSVTHSGTTSKEKIDNCIDVLSKIKNRLQKQGIYCDYQHEYQAFVERCVTSLLSMIRNNGDGHDSNIMSYLFENLMRSSNIGDIIKYLDNERIYRFFNL